MLRRAAGLAALLVCCTAWAQAEEGSCPQLDLGQDLPLSDDQRVVLTADKVVLESGGISQFEGTVRLRHAGQSFDAEALAYDEAQRRVVIRDGSLFRNRQMMILSSSAEFDLDSESGSFYGTEFTLRERAARGQAGRITVTRAGEAELVDVAYTTCAPGDDSWRLEASRITLDQEEGLGTARHAKLRFFNVPILYTPYVQFPINDARRTGFLFPLVGNSDNTGFDFRWPFYWNLAPNTDMEITPRYLSQRGLQLGTQWRYLLENHRGQAYQEYLGDDRRFGANRSLIDFEHLGLINRRLGVDARYAEVSDFAYFEDLGGRLDFAAITHLERHARLIYQAPAVYTLQGMVQDFQTIDRAVLPENEPYQRLPQLLFEGQTRNTLLATRGGLSGEYVNFVRDTGVEGQRLDLYPFLRAAEDRASWFAAGEFGWRYTQYQLTNTAPEETNDVERSLPMFSADAGGRLERITAAGWLQTVEPRLFYLFVPFREQATLPVFDSGLPDFDVAQLFARNRFTGVDRVADANHLTTAVTTRLLDPDDGEVKLSASIGQIYRFKAPRVSLPGFPRPGSGGTDVVAGLDYRLSRRFSGAVVAQWSPDEPEFNRTSTLLRYRDESRVIALGYRYRRDLLDQTDASVSTPLWGGLRVGGRWRYSLADARSLETLAGLEYSTCCWAMRAYWRRYLANTNGDFDSGIYLQLELKGLARIGTGFEELLPAEDEALP